MMEVGKLSITKVKMYSKYNFEYSTTLIFFKFLKEEFFYDQKL